MGRLTLSAKRHVVLAALALVVFVAAPVFASPAPSTVEFNLHRLEQLKARVTSSHFALELTEGGYFLNGTQEDFVRPATIQVEFTNSGSPLAFAITYSSSNSLTHEKQPPPEWPPVRNLLITLDQGESATITLTIHPVFFSNGTQPGGIRLSIPETGKVHLLGYFATHTPGPEVVWHLRRAGAPLLVSVAIMSGITLALGAFGGSLLAKRSNRNRSRADMIRWKDQSSTLQDKSIRPASTEQRRKP